jgi:hypothetical protein
VELYNTYEDIEGAMASYVGEVMTRYEEFGRSTISEEEWRSRLWKDGKAIAIIAEEATTYADFISDKDLLSKFAKVSATLSRKQEMPVTFVAHNNTQSCLGDIKGLANLIARMQQIQLLPTTDPLTSQPVASGKALIRLDGSTEWMEVTTPKIEKKITVFRRTSESDRPPQPVEDISPDDLWEAARQRLNQVWEMPTTPEPPEPSPEPLNQPNDKGSSNSDKRFTQFNLTREALLGLINSLNAELNQTQIIERLWQVRKGGSAAWKEAYEQFKEVTGGGDD